MFIVKFSTVALIALAVAGCGTLYLSAPPQENVRLLAKNERAEVSVEKHVWFKLWGKTPINPDDVKASKIIEEQGLKEARLKMTNTFVDGLYSIIPGIFGFPRRTLVVEGNRELHDPVSGQVVKTSVPPAPVTVQPVVGGLK